MKEGWEYKKLGDVAFYPTKRISSEMVNENNYVGVDNLIKDRGGKVVANFFPTEGNVIEYLKGDVLLGNIRPYLKKIWLSDTKGGASGDVLIIRANDTKHLYPNYLYWALASDQFFEYDNLHCKGAKMPRGNKIDIMQYLLPIPTIEEQQQIVSELDLLSGVIEKQKTQLEELDKLAQSIFYDMFGEYDDNTPVSSYIKNLSGGKSLAGDIKCDNKVLKTGAVTFDYFNQNEVKYLPINYSPLPEHLVNDGDVLVSRMNTPELVGACAYVWKAPSNTYLPDRLWRASLNENINPIFLWISLIQPKAKEQIRALASGTSGSMKNISKPNFLRVKIKGVPLSLQQEFAAKMEAIEAMKAKVRQSLKEAETLFNERMDYYFN